ncbi:MAG: nuclear transport factor 2 family protein [Cyanobacteria bacterium P01_D01_bin.105]
MKDKIIKLEERLRLAMLNSDIAELDELISPDLLFTNHFGTLVSKEDDLNAHASKAFVFESLDLSELKILVYENSAVVSVRAEIQGYYNDQPTNGSFRFTRFWSNTSGKWQVVAGHSSVIA